MAYEFEALANGRDEMLLRATTQIEGKTWWFELPIPSEHWDDLFRLTKSIEVKDAYAMAPGFWNSLVEEAAETLKQTIEDPHASNRHLRAEKPTYSQVEQRYRKFEANGSH